MFREFIDTIEHIGYITDQGGVEGEAFLELVVSLLIMFGLRFILVMRSNRLPLFKHVSTSRRKRGAIVNHIGLEIIIAFLIAFFLICIIKTNSSNIIINAIVAPLLGLVASLCIDNWYLIPKEASTMFNKGGQANLGQANSLSDMVAVVDKIDESMLDSDEFRPIVARSINHITEVQLQHEEKIDNISAKCDKTIETLSKLQKASINDKRAFLKEGIYQCLDQGFVTPKQRDQLSIAYESYRELGGNSEIQHLYEEHFISLPIHEERRIQSTPVEVDRRAHKSKPTYGQYDESK